MAQIAITAGEDGLRAIGLELFVPCCRCWPRPARASPRRWRDLTGAGGVQARRAAGADPPSRRRGPDLLPQPQRHHRRAARDRRGHPLSPAGRPGGARRRGAGDERRRAGGFQDTMSQIDADAPPEGVVTFLFDLLHLDGADLLDTPLAERSARLAAIAPDLKVPGVVTADPAAAAAVLAESLAAGHEGVVVKDAASTYAAGRRGASWRKVKPVLTFDLVVLGAEWGHGRRRGWLSNLHLGARGPGRGGVRDGRQDVQGPDRRAPALADRPRCWSASAPGRGSPCSSPPSWWSRSPSTACRPRPATGGGGAALRPGQALPAHKEPEAADTIATLRALLPGSPGVIGVPAACKRPNRPALSGRWDVRLPQERKRPNGSSAAGQWDVCGPHGCKRPTRPSAGIVWDVCRRRMPPALANCR